jgi:hypothetical protein
MHEEIDETHVLYNSKDKYFLLKERRSLNPRLARAVTPRVVRGARYQGKGMRSWTTWGDRTDVADV